MSPGTAAVLAAGITALVAAAAIGGNVLTTRMNLQQARTLAEDARIWDKRADLYWRTVTLTVFDRLHGYSESEYRRDLLGCQSELVVWGSPKVRSAMQRVVETGPGIASDYQHDVHEDAIDELAMRCRAELWESRSPVYQV